MTRPPVDVVVPFRGSAADLDELRERLAGLALQEGDSILVVDNTPGAAPAGDGIPVLRAAERQTPGYARNCGAGAGSADWLVFLDADVFPAPDLIERYFEPVPAEATGLLAGGLVDEPVPPGGRAVARYAYLRALKTEDDFSRMGERGYPETANVACRRAAFDAVDGFREDLRAAEDADLTYRIKAGGWGLERRDAATAVHRNRQTLRAYVAQKALHGSGGAWLDREYPGTFPAKRRPGLLWWGVRSSIGGLVTAALQRSRDDAIWALFLPLEVIVWEFGRSIPNERPLPERSFWARVRAAVGWVA